jgi:hypothetical protein
MARVSRFTTWVAGVSYRRESVARCHVGEVVRLVRSPSNRHDKNAIEVHAGEQIGFIPQDEAETLAPVIDSGGIALAHIEEFFGEGGVRLKVTLVPPR